MPTMIIRQPDGKLAALSSVVDDLTASDMTEEEAIGFLVEHHDCGRRTAEQKVTAGVEDHVPYKVGVRGGGLERWDHALQQIGMQHGRVGLRSTLEQTGFSDYDLSHVDIHFHEDAEADDGGPVQAV